MTRVLVANRGAVARRIIRYYREEESEVETVSVFHEPDVEQPWVDEADYAVYLNGATLTETYLDPQRMVSAAVDAGCDAVHPGFGLLTEHQQFHWLAAQANLAIIGADSRLVRAVQSRAEVHRIAKSKNIATIPASEDIADGADPAPQAALIGFPLYVKASAGGSVRRVTEPGELAKAVATVREEAGRRSGDRRVYLQEAVEDLKTVATVIVADKHGTLVHLGHYGDSLQGGGRWWIAEMGAEVVPEGLAVKLGEAALALAREFRWVGIGRVRWALTPTGGWYLLGLSVGLPSVYALVDEMLGIDLLRAQIQIDKGEPLGWEGGDVSLDRHGIQVRLLHVDSVDLSRPSGTLSRIEVPEGVSVVVGTAEGQPCTPETDQVLAEFITTGPTRQAALVRARQALEGTVIEGVPNNRDALLHVFSREETWNGEYDANSLAAWLGTWEA